MNAAYLEEAQETTSADWIKSISQASNRKLESTGIQSVSDALLGLPKFYTGDEAVRGDSLSESLWRDRPAHVIGTGHPSSSSRQHTGERDQGLNNELAQAESMLERPRDEDEEDTSAFSSETLLRAKTFLLGQSKQFRKICGHFPPVPRIGSGPNGSVDLYWKEKDWELLINIPAEDGKMATFYGDDYGAQKIKGSFDPNSFNYGIVPWLIRS